MISWANLKGNQLVDRNALLNAISNGVLALKSGQSVPSGQRCVSVSEASAWLNIDTSFLPTSGRMPVKSEFVPASTAPSVPESSYTQQVQYKWTSGPSNNGGYQPGSLIIDAIDLSTGAVRDTVALPTAYDLSNPYYRTFKVIPDSANIRYKLTAQSNWLQTSVYFTNAVTGTYYPGVALSPGQTAYIDLPKVNMGVIP